jgi:hypothetical protein
MDNPGFFRAAFSIPVCLSDQLLERIVLRYDFNRKIGNESLDPPLCLAQLLLVGTEEAYVRPMRVCSEGKFLFRNDLTQAVFPHKVAQQRYEGIAKPVVSRRVSG